MSWKLLVAMSVLAFGSAFLGSMVLTLVHNDFMKPLLLVILGIIAVYTFAKKDFGSHQAKGFSTQAQLFLGIGISLPIGFYDGFIGPGTGSFLVLAFVTLLGFDFLQASANAKW